MRNRGKLRVAGLAFATLFALAGAGCATSPYQNMWGVNKDKAYSEENWPKVETGTMRRSDFYRGLFDVIAGLPSYSTKVAAMKELKELINKSEMLELGLITKDGMEAYERETAIRFAEIRQRQAGSDAMGAYFAAQMFGAPSPIQIPQTPPPPRAIRCVRGTGMFSNETTCY